MKSATALFRASCRLSVALLLFAFGVPAAQSQPPMIISADVSNPVKRRIPVRLRMAAKAGKYTFVYPRWLPGMHAVEGPLGNVAKLGFSANGKSIAWSRDRYDAFVFHVVAPKGTTDLQVTYDYVPPVQSNGEVFYGVASSKTIAVVNPSAFALAPLGNPQKMSVVFQLRVPKDWHVATALVRDESASATSLEWTVYKPTTLYTLVDSPVMAGAFHKSVALKTDPKDVPHTLDLFADDTETLKRDVHLVPLFERMTRESLRLFQSRHYDSFRFMLALTNDIGRNGLEHHASVAYVLSPTDLDRTSGQIKASLMQNWTANLIPHEFVHSWNGKFRRPYGEDAPTNAAPQTTDLIWVYEGLTEYLGEILMVRSGFRTAEEWRLDLARRAAEMRIGAGRDWQSIADSTVAAPYVYVYGNGTSLRPTVDLYYESMLVWLEADAIIRTKSGGKRSLDDFCRRFFGGKNNGAELKPYRLPEIVATLNETQKYDWDSFVQKRFYAPPQGFPSNGFDAAGWNLVFADAPVALISDAESDLRFSLGIRIASSGQILTVLENSLAEQKGITVGMTVWGVNGIRFTLARLREMLLQSGKPDNRTILELLISDKDRYFTLQLPETKGERFPSLKRQTGAMDWLMIITTPLVDEKSPM